MQSSKNRPYQDRPKRKKPARPPQDTSPTYAPPDPRPKGRQPRYNRRDEQDTYYPRNAPNDGVFVYRQDLLQKGFDVFSASRSAQQYTELADRFPECFTSTKRKVIIDNADPTFDDTSFSQSRIQMRDDLREDLGHLIDNEEIPDWFLDAPAPQNAKPVLFDFGNTVSRTQQVNKEIAKRIDSNPLTLVPRPAELEEINFEELDNKLEANYIKSKVLAPSDDEDEVFDLDLDRPYGESTKDAPRMSDLGPREPVSMNESSDCFNDLEHHIKKMLFNEKQSGSEGGEDSEESFNESLGFETNRDTQALKNMIDPSTRNAQPASNSHPAPNTILSPPVPPSAAHPAPKPQPPLTLIQDLQSSIRPVESYLIPPNVMSVNRALCNSLNNSLSEPDAQLKEAIENDETLKLTPAEKALRQQAFMDKYGYLDPILNQLCYEILNSKRRAQMNPMTANGFNQKSVEKYCANRYKIFSLFLQGNIVEKLWFYKDKLGIVHGPFMSYDMDVWNGENNFFSDDLLVSLDNSPFLNIKLWVNRSSVVMRIVDDFMHRRNNPPKANLPPLSRAHTIGSQPVYPPYYGAPAHQGKGGRYTKDNKEPRDRDSRNHGHQRHDPELSHTAVDSSKYDKKVSFHKKSDNDQAGGPSNHPPAGQTAQLLLQPPAEPAPKAKAPEELQRNYAELFPGLEEADKPESKHPNRIKKASHPPTASTQHSQPPQPSQPTLSPQQPQQSAQPRSGELHLLEALKGVTSRPEETNDSRRSDRGPSAKGPEPVPVLVAPKKDDKPLATTKKESEQDAQTSPRKKGRTEPDRMENKKPGPVPQSSNRQPAKKGGNQPAPRKEEAPVYVAKDVPQEDPKKTADKPPQSTKEGTRINQEGTNSIKNLLGLSW